MSFDEFCDLVENFLRSKHGWNEMQVADFVSPRMCEIIQSYREGGSIEQTADLLQTTSPGRQYWD